MYLKLCLVCPGKRKRHKILSDLEEIHHLLSPPLATKASLLEARAMANIRLVHAFGLNTSTFTSASTEVNQSFRRNVAARMKAINSIDDWKDVGDYVLLICGQFLQRQPIHYNYDEFIQVIVFKTVLFTFFQVSTSNEPLDFAEVSQVTNGINKLWIVSKSPDFQKTSNLELLHINRLLHKWIGPDPDNPFTQNPLEIIIPAYETMWRLVAHAYALIKLNPEYTNTFLAFSDNPTMVQFKAPGNNNGSANVENIINETLRLHPPTKRIKRALPFSWMRNTDVPWMRQCFASLGFQCFAEREIVSANIEGLHTSSVWDPLHAHEFDASRHRNLTEEQKQSFLPFGYGPLKCIAMEFAPRYCAIILGSLLKIEDTVLTRGETHGEREGWQGWKFGIQPN